MNIHFPKEPDGSISAVAFDAEYDGYRHDELYYADLNEALGGWMVRYQDDYSNPVHVASEVEAKKHVLQNHFNHKPFSNGRRYEL